MQYALIIVNHKAGYMPLTYSIPSSVLAYVERGSVVRVPVGQQVVHGVVTRFMRGVESSLALKIKPIKSVVYGGAFVPDYVLDTVYDLQQKYGLNQSDGLFPLLPPLPQKKYPTLDTQTTPSSQYKCIEYSVGLPERVALYKKLFHSLKNQGQSLLILCPNQAAVSNLKRALANTTCRAYPATPTPKQQRDYYFLARAPHQPTLFIGTRGALITPLYHIGAVAIEEPWLPGHKEERTPKMWTALLADSLCKARGIPLYLLTILPWPESQLLPGLRRYSLRSQTGPIQLAPARPLAETLTQFLAEYGSEQTQLAIFYRPSTTESYWCPQCRTFQAGGGGLSRLAQSVVIDW